jgi:cytochrome c2
MRKSICHLVTAVLAMVPAVAFGGQDVDGLGDARAGRDFAIKNCTECHRVTTRAPKLRRADGPPDFVAIANTASITPTSLYVFLHSPHPTMPNIILSDKESADVIAYIVSLRNPSK